jgi:hypothetical protein
LRGWIVRRAWRGEGAVVGLIEGERGAWERGLRNERTRPRVKTSGTVEIER